MNRQFIITELVERGDEKRIYCTDIVLYCTYNIVNQQLHLLSFRHRQGRADRYMPLPFKGWYIEYTNNLMSPQQSPFGEHYHYAVQLITPYMMIVLYTLVDNGTMLKG